MADNAVTIQNPRKIEVPLVRVVTGVSVGLTEVAAIFADEQLNRSANNITAIQNILPIVGTAAGIALALMKNKTARQIGNDMAVGYGAIATLKLGNVARSTISGSKIKNLREIALKRGGQLAQSIPGSRMTSMSFA